MSFWILYAYDRELVYPEQLDKIIPTWLNHAMHTVVLVLLMLELFVVQHRWPNHKGCLAVLVTFCSSYLLWVLWIQHRSSIWVYPILEVLSPIGLCIFLTAAVLEVAKVIDEGGAVDVVYVNFSKAFDKIPPGRLIQKIKMHGIHSDLATWIQNWIIGEQGNYIGDREAVVKIRVAVGCGGRGVKSHKTATVSESCGNLTPFPDPFQQKLLDLQKEGFEHLAGKLDQMIDLMGNIAQSLSALPLIQAEPAVPVIRCPSPTIVSHRAKLSTPEQNESTSDPFGDPELDTDTQKEVDYRKPIRLPLKSHLPSLRRTMKPISS
eukprot:g43910.t1